MGCVPAASRGAHSEIYPEAEKARPVPSSGTRR